ncbi:proline/glycine betaine transporter [Yersinia thracica]|uniref:Proline/glycine betaine transporter n=1 Tax=Yersinia thracica TaxID=2890319 RepID=A0A0T9QC45_9GAMM|nr:MFS transporter [Yersinia thracica]CNI05041.1 proline/glycine betaine transporter [Yersinia thracica]
MKWRFRLGAVAGNTLEYYDIAVFAAISGYLSAEFERQGISQADHIVWGIFALRFLTRPLGGYLIGHYADRVGRKAALILTSSIAGVATLCMALLPISVLGYYAPLVVLLLQLILSLSFGGELASLATYLFNDSASNERARITSLIVASSLVGVFASLFIVYVLEHRLTSTNMQAYGWRIPLLLGIFNIAMSFWLRIKLPAQPAINCQQRVNWAKIVQIILIMIPSQTVFYAQNMSTSIIRESLHLGDFKNWYSMLSTLFLLIILMLTGWLIDKLSTSLKASFIGIYSLILFSPCLYFLLTSDNITLVILTQFFITVTAAIILCSQLSIAAIVTDGHTANLGVGLNVSASLFGGVTPLIINAVLPFGLAYAGVYLSLSALITLLSYYLFIQTKALN